jgi:hypothetical protein
MLADWTIREFGVQENWKFASVETPKARSPEARRVEVVGHDDVTEDYVETWDVCHMSLV